jgi:hypothetical protein
MRRHTQDNTAVVVIYVTGVDNDCVALRAVICYARKSDTVYTLLATVATSTSTCDYDMQS